MGKVIFTITVPADKVKTIKRHSRATFGKPGKGRKTTFKDRKKDANKRACKKPPEEE
jgi:hypothetical protein